MQTKNHTTTQNILKDITIVHSIKLGKNNEIKSIITNHPKEIREK